MLAQVSRWVREGPPSRWLPWRLRAPLERWTVSAAYPPAPDSLRFPVPTGASTVVLFGGDVALHRVTATDDLDGLLGGLARLLRSAQASIVNLESQFVIDRPPVGVIGSAIRADPAGIGMLSFLGVRAVTCANNHSMDFGAAGLAESVARVESAGIAVAGVTGEGRDGAAVLDLDGIRLGLLAYTDDWRAGAEPAPEPAPVPHDPGRVRRDIAALRQRADLVAVQLHWGYEWSMYPMRRHRDLARSYVEAGANIVVCHHAHVPMGIERWKDGVVAHGLGNLYFGRGPRDDHPFRYASFLLRVACTLSGSATAQIVPVHTDRNRECRPAEGLLAERVRRSVGCLSRRLGEDGYLDAVEQSLLTRQACLILLDLAQRLSRSDESGALERVRWLTTPRQRELVSWLAERDAPLRDIGQCLARLRDDPHLLARPAERAGIQALVAPARRHLGECEQLGRIP